MQIVCHMGASNMDGDRISRTLQQNARNLQRSGILAPSPDRYARLMRDAVTRVVEAVEGREATRLVRDDVLARILDGDDVRRLVMTSSDFITLPNWILRNSRFYGAAVPRLAALNRLFEDDTIEIFVALRNPATFFPAVWYQTGLEWDVLVGKEDPLSARWSELVTRIRRAAPDARLCVWCNEDAPFIWGTLLRRFSGLGPEAAINGEYDLLAGLVSPAGMQGFLSHVKSHPDLTELQLRQLIGATLDRHALPEAAFEVVDAPGWDAEFVDAITRAYDEDVAHIAQMPDVEFLAP